MHPEDRDKTWFQVITHAVKGWVKVIMILVGLVCFLAAGLWLYGLGEKKKGAQEWIWVKVELEAKGEKLDWASFVPGPISDELNFAKAKGVEEILYKDRPSSELRRRIQKWNLSNLTLRLADSDMQSRSDMVAIAQGLIVGGEGSVMNEHTAPETIQAWAESNTAGLDVIERAALRPMTQFPVSATNGFMSSALNFVSMRSLAQTVSLLAATDLAVENEAKALDRLRINFAMTRGLENGVTLVEAMIGVAIENITFQVVWEGLVNHQWDDSQLIELEQILATKDWPSALQRAFRAERAAMVGIFEQFDKPLSFSGSWPAVPANQLSLKERLQKELYTEAWVEQAKAKYCELIQISAIALYDPESRIFRRTRFEDTRVLLNELSTSKHPRDQLTGAVIPNFFKAYIVAARTQIRIDHMRIAIAIERCRTNYGTLPKSLDDLSPEFLKEVPRDLIGGEPYHYQPLDEERYKIWSIGWNEGDENGLIDSDREKGGWVWFSFAKDQAPTP